MKWEIPESIKEIVNALEAGGFESYLVGGCVRDRLLGLSPSDYDICTAARPEQMKDCLSDMKIVETGLKHGTLTIVNRGTACEVTTFRQEGPYTDKRRPDHVYFTACVDQDLARRDFTINAMAYGKKGLIDLFGGRRDLAAGVIRTVGSAEQRFDEDSLRILRALRFAARLDFTIDEATFSAMQNKKALLKTLAAERVASELTGLVQGRAVQRVSEQALEILSVVIQNPCVVPDSLIQDPCVRLAALCRNDPGAPARLKLSKQMGACMQTLAGFDAPLPQTEPEALFLLGKLGVKQAVLLCEYRRDSRALSLVKQVYKSKKPYKIAQLAVKGEDLKRLGLSGPEIGAALEALLNMVIRGELNNQKKAMISYLSQRSFAQSEGPGK